MKAGFFKKCASAFVLAVGLAHGTCAAEFRCATEVSYRWVKTSNGPAVTVATQGGTPQAGGGAVGGAQSPAPSDTNLVRLMGVERAGSDEATARQRLQLEVDRQRVRASEACKRDHESFGSCVAMKLGARASTLNSLSFSARAELEKALSDECRQQEGTCLGVEVAEPRCSEVVEAKGTPPPAAGGATAEKKSDAKKK